MKNLSSNFLKYSLSAKLLEYANYLGSDMKCFSTLKKKDLFLVVIRQYF